MATAASGATVGVVHWYTGKRLRNNHAGKSIIAVQLNTPASPKVPRKMIHIPSVGTMFRPYLSTIWARPDAPHPQTGCPRAFAISLSSQLKRYPNDPARSLL